MTIEITDTTSSTGTSTTRVAKKELGKDDFLLLLTKQLQNQDPMNPTDNAEFSSQMTSYSTLEQITNMASSLESFLTLNASNYKVQAMGLLGREVTALPSTATESITGTVSSVKFVDGEAVFTVGDQEISMAEIESINTTS